MKSHNVVIMQPYFLPYRSYFGLIRRCNDFVIFDDVQFCRKWQQRNFVPNGSGKKQWLTVPVISKRPHLQKISEVRICHKSNWQQKMIASVKKIYANHKAFDQIFPEFKRIMTTRYERLVNLNVDLLKWVSHVSGLKEPNWYFSSDLGYNDMGRNERLVQICLSLKATNYVCGPAAKVYLREDLFEDVGIKVIWHEESYPPYEQQLTTQFDHFVSIIDLLMNHGPESRIFLEPLHG